MTGRKEGVGVNFSPEEGPGPTSDDRAVNSDDVKEAELEMLVLVEEEVVVGSPGIPPDGIVVTG